MLFSLANAASRAKVNSIMQLGLAVRYGALRQTAVCSRSTVGGEIDRSYSVFVGSALTRSMHIACIRTVTVAVSERRLIGGRCFAFNSVNLHESTSTEAVRRTVIVMTERYS